MLTALVNLTAIPTRMLTKREAAEQCGFLRSVHDAWVRRGLLPGPDCKGEWSPEALDDGLRRLVTLGYPPASKPVKKWDYASIPHCHLVWRKISGDSPHPHPRWRHKGESKALPNPWGSPDFFRVLIEFERAYASRQQNESAKSPPLSPQDLESHCAALPVVPQSLSPPLRPHPLSEIRPVPRRGLRREEAAVYVGVSAGKFDEMVDDGRMPAPRRIDRRKVWDRLEIDVAFDSLPSENPNSQGSTWDDFRAP